MSVRFALAAVLALLALSTSAAAAAAAAASAEVAVNVSPAVGGVRVRFDWPHPVSAIRLNDDVLAVSSAWKGEHGTRFSKGRITSRAKKRFSKAELFLPAAREEVDRIYPAVIDLGQARYLVLIQFLRPATTKKIVFAINGRRVVSSNPTGYVYVSSKSALHDEFSIVSEAGAPAWLPAYVAKRRQVAWDFYRNQMGSTPPSQPNIAINYSPDGIGSWRGDAPPGDWISMRFRGLPWRTPDARMYGWVDRFTAHEIFHAWNSPSDRDGEIYPWLHEGSAEYASMLASGAGAGSPATLSEVGERYTRCEAVLGGRSLRQAVLKDGTAIYDCGVVLQWLLDAESGAAGDGAFFDVWRRLIAKGRDYGLSDFEQVLKGRGLDDGAIASFLDHQGQDRATDLQAQLRLGRRGVALQPVFTDDALRQRALFHLFSVACSTEDYGFWTEEAASNSTLAKNAEDWRAVDTSTPPMASV